jgi:hypothetical protein
MITIETQKPVYSNLGGKTKEQKQATRQKALDKSRAIYSKGKETGILAGFENLFMGNKNPMGSADTYTGDKPPVDDKSGDKKPMNPALKWGLIVGGVAVVGVAVWYFGFRTKKSA